ncbi:MAG TPA: TRAP transporter substrate-binding protein [Xanthobacteraceae bacterium]|nr:TRAP transporter substrate-binding protein [Xanthobacteraceae bacterium]
MQRSTLLLKAGAILAIGAGPAFAQKQTLRMAHWSGPAHQMVQTQEAWAKTVTEASGGNLVIEVDKAPLAKPDGQYDLIRNGVRDLVWHIPAYTPGRMDMMRVAELPFTCPNSTICSPVLWKWYEKYKLADREFTDGVMLLNTFTTGPFAIHTTKPARTLEELRAIKLRIAGAGVPIGKALGFAVIALPATDAYETLQRGTVDGTVFPWEAIPSFRLAELVKFHLEIPGGLYASSFNIVGNQKAINNLTPANKAALLKASGAAGSRLYGKAWDAADERGRADAVKRNNTIETIKSAELDRWRPLLQFVTDDWIKKANERGLDGAKMYEDLKAMIKAEPAS